MIIPTPHPERHRVETVMLPAFAEVPEHTHNVDVTLSVLGGGIFLNINGHAHWLAHGRHYFIPANVQHAVQIGRHATTLALINHYIHPRLHQELKKGLLHV